MIFAGCLGEMAADVGRAVGAETVLVTVGDHARIVALIQKLKRICVHTTKKKTFFNK